MKLTDEPILQALSERRVVRRKDWVEAQLTLGAGNKVKVIYLDWAKKQRSQSLSLEDLVANDWETSK